MRVIYNRYIPFGNFYAINLFGVIFARTKYGEMTKRDLNHEYIHTLQQREMLYVFFYLWYIMEWFTLMLKYRSVTKAYRNISFEKEAYENESDLDYHRTRRMFAWMRGRQNSKQ